MQKEVNADVSRAEVPRKFPAVHGAGATKKWSGEREEVGEQWEMRKKRESKENIM